MRWLDANYDIAMFTENGTHDGWPVDALDSQKECEVCAEPLGYGVPIVFDEGRPVRHQSCEESE